MPSYVSLSTFTEAMLLKPVEVRRLFPETIKLANLLTVIPASSATAERSFSCLRRLKTWLRSTMSQSRLNSIAILHAHRDIEPIVEDIICEFVGLNEARLRLFGDVFSRKNRNSTTLQTDIISKLFDDRPTLLFLLYHLADCYYQYTI